MSEVKTKPNRITVLLSIALLLFACWMYCRLHYGVEIRTGCFIAEGLFFLLVYAADLFMLPVKLSYLLVLVGTAALSCLHGLSSGAMWTDYLLPLTYLPVLLFFLSQSEGEAKKRAASPERLLLVMQGIYPALFLGLILYCLVVKEFTFSLDFVFYILAFAAVCVLYIFVMQTPMKGQETAKKKTKESSFLQMRSAFLFAVIVIPETGVFLLVMKQTLLAHTLPLLWVLNLFLLWEQGHPLVCALTDRAQKKMQTFLNA